MSLARYPDLHPTKGHHLRNRHRRPTSARPSASSLGFSVPLHPEAKNPALGHQEDMNLRMNRMKEMFRNLEVSVSAYDTAWVAMIPSSSAGSPLFPQCLNWVLENQRRDGSFDDLHDEHPCLLRSSLTSTLACVLALKKWNVGDKYIEKGLYFIESKFEDADKYEEQHSPIGFDIIFPGLLEYAKNLNLNLPLSASHVRRMLDKRDSEFRRICHNNSKGKKACLAYLAEGLGQLLGWEEVMKYQRKNGSLFNSPSATAAALINLQDTRCFEYLTSLLCRFQDAVPTIYPLDIYARLLLVDNIEKLGIDRYFRNEINTVMDDTYRCWLENDEDLFSDVTTAALAFRHLRMNGYEICSDVFDGSKEVMLSTSMEGHTSDISAVLELYRASQITASRSEPALQNLKSWSSDFLKKKLSMINQRDEFTRVITKEVDYALKFPFHMNLERLASRRNIENCNAASIHILKAPYKINNVNHKDFIGLAIEDFTWCQSLYREELQQLDRWVEENRLHHLTFARQKLSYCYFSAASTLFAPEMATARMSWAKNGVLTTVVDDFFDIGGSREELENLIELVQKMDASSPADCCSSQVEIIFSALCSTISDLVAAAMSWQGRNIRGHLKQIWLNLLRSMMKEAEWKIDKKVPTLDEYMTNSRVSFALGPIILPALYFVGPVISDEVINLPEYEQLFLLTSTCGRLLNDVQGFQRESSEGKLSSISLYMRERACASEEEAIRQIRSTIDESRHELLGLVVKNSGSEVPRACKDLFWKMCRILHLFYANCDGFTSPKEMMGAIYAVIHAPLDLSSS
ncbi:Ent-kaur-16-ene synthase [Nymphaea thermarum]|nr:Ent-kaur-16-ene synthase [Nymphaea thermarum]